MGMRASDLALTKLGVEKRSGHSVKDLASLSDDESAQIHSNISQKYQPLFELEGPRVVVAVDSWGSHYVVHSLTELKAAWTACRGHFENVSSYPLSLWKELEVNPHISVRALS